MLHPASHDDRFPGRGRAARVRAASGCTGGAAPVARPLRSVGPVPAGGRHAGRGAGPRRAHAGLSLHGRPRDALGRPGAGARQLCQCVARTARLCPCRQWHRGGAAQLVQLLPAAGLASAWGRTGHSAPARSGAVRRRLRLPGRVRCAGRHGVLRPAAARASGAAARAFSTAHARGRGSRAPGAAPPRQVPGCRGRAGPPRRS